MNKKTKEDGFLVILFCIILLCMNITGGKYKGRQVLTPDEKITRPTLSKVRMGIFNSLYSLLGDFEGLSFFDVFGGSGVMGIEALSRGFSDVTVIEQNKKAANIIKKNYEQLGIKPNLIIGNALNIIPKLTQKYTVAYVDPPYASGIYEDVYEQLKDVANIIVLEHPEKLKLEIVDITKQKKYGDKIITYIETT